MSKLFCLLMLASFPLLAEEDLAKSHFLAGEAYYSQTNYSNALREFREAYKLSNRPEFLFNIARCHESLGQTEMAILHFEEYLRQLPAVQDRMNIEDHIASLKSRMDTPTPSPAPIQPLHRHHKRVWTWVVGGLGIGLLGGAIGTGLAASNAQTNLNNSCFNATCSLDLHPSAKQDAERGQSLAVATDVLWPIGVVAVCTGIILFFVEK